MGRTRDIRTTIWGQFPQYDREDYPDMKPRKNDSGFHGKSEELKKSVRDAFFDDEYLNEIFTDPDKRNKLKLWYRFLKLLGKVDLKVKVRMPHRPNIYYVNDDWEQTGDYYIDPIEIWQSHVGQKTLADWKSTSTAYDIQKPTFDRDRFMELIKSEEHGDVVIDDTHADGDYIGELKLRDDEDED